MQELFNSTEVDRPSENAVRLVLEWLSSTTSAVLMQQPAGLLKNDGVLGLSKKEIWQS